jgi:ectoine hydroxylase-related dioxygenase (phytanoyl-CoA dioxygenase family)
MDLSEVEDLSHFHQLLTDDLFERPRSEEDWEQYKLSSEQIQFFETNGYLANVPMINEHVIEVLKEELQEISEKSHPKNHLFYEFHSNESADPNQVLFHALGAWRITKGFHDVLWNPRFIMAARQLLHDKPIRFWHDQLFAKPPKLGGVVAWHQDYSYWTRTKPMEHLTCWCGLDQSNQENGCLQYIPGSHQWGLLPKPVIAGDFCSIENCLTEEQKRQFQNPVFVETKPGEAVFHHPLTLHGSNANTSEHQPRRAFVINVFADGVYSDSNESLLDGVAVVPKGEQMKGQFFPLLY